MEDPPISAWISGHDVRAGTLADAPACNSLCRRVHAFERAGEVTDAITPRLFRVVEHGGWITGYTTGIGWFTHRLGESNSDLMALIGSALEYAGPGYLLPTRNADLFRWCLVHGLRVVQQMTLRRPELAGSNTTSPAPGAPTPGASMQRATSLGCP